MALPLTVDNTFPALYRGSGEAVTPGLSSALIRAGLVLTLLAAPLAFGAVQAWAWASLAVVASLLLIAWAIANMRHGSFKIMWSPLYLPAGLFFLLVVIQFACHLTMDSIATRESLVKLATDLIFFFLAGQILRAPVSGYSAGKTGTRGDAQRPAKADGDFTSIVALRWILVAYTFFLSLFAIFQFFSSQGLIYWTVKTQGWTFGPYVNHNHYAGLMEMLIPLSVASVLPAFGRHPSAALLGVAILLPIASVLLSGSRGGVISLSVECLLAALLVLFFGPRRARPATALVAGVAVVAAALLFFWMAPRDIAERITRTAGNPHQTELDLSGRMEAARNTLGIFRAHPWLGVGLGSFEIAFPAHETFASDLRWDHAHNDYAEALAETGLAGAAIILFALGLFFHIVFKEVISRQWSVVRPTSGSLAPSTSDSALRIPDMPSRLPSPESRVPGPVLSGTWHLTPNTYLRLGATLGCCGILAHSLSDFNLHIPANAAWFAVCVTVATSLPPDFV